MLERSASRSLFGFLLPHRWFGAKDPFFLLRRVLVKLCCLIKLGFCENAVHAVNQGGHLTGSSLGRMLTEVITPPEGI